MNKISVCMIVKDEEKVLERCLKCVKGFADEVVVVDTGSSDRSKEIAKKYTDKVFDFQWNDDFSQARNYSFSKATCDYIMWIDADDIILEEDILKIWDFKLSRTSDLDVLMFKYVTDYNEDYKPKFSFYRERIVKRLSGFVWNDPVHEVITPHGKIAYFDINVYHAKMEVKSSSRNLIIYQKYISNGNKLSPRQQFYYARELYYNNLLEEAIHNFHLFLSSHNGWIENNIEACLILSKCYQLRKDYDKALTSLFGSFAMAKPRSEILCEIGKVYIELKRYDEAIYWLGLAKKQKPKLKNGGFVSLDAYNFTPNLELCVAYYHKGYMKRARHYHELTKKENPLHPSVKYNERCFK